MSAESESAERMARLDEEMPDSEEQAIRSAGGLSCFSKVWLERDGQVMLSDWRVKTTSITLETGKGEFAQAIALGIVLLTLSFIVNAALVRGGAVIVRQ